MRQHTYTFLTIHPWSGRGCWIDPQVTHYPNSYHLLCFLVPFRRPHALYSFSSITACWLCWHHRSLHTHTTSILELSSISPKILLSRTVCEALIIIFVIATLLFTLYLIIVSYVEHISVVKCVLCEKEEKNSRQNSNFDSIYPIQCQSKYDYS